MGRRDRSKVEASEIRFTWSSESIRNKLIRKEVGEEAIHGVNRNE